jgi:hypothetical protein
VGVFFLTPAFQSSLQSAEQHSEPETGRELLHQALHNVHFPHVHSILANPFMATAIPSQRPENSHGHISHANSLSTQLQSQAKIAWLLGF